MLDKRYNPEHQAHIVRLLEWVMILPEVLEKRLDELIEEYMRERGTTFVSRFAISAIDSLETLESRMDVALDAPTLQAFAEALPHDTTSAS